VDFLAGIRQDRLMIDVRRLRALAELAEHGTIAAAAAHLHLTPSAVSQQLSALEREVGQQLIEPDGRRVRLTPAAHVLLDHAVELFAQLERLNADLDAHASGEAGLVRIGAFPTAICEIVAPAARTLGERAPQVKLEVTEAEAPQAFELLTAGDADVVLGMESEFAPASGDGRFTRRKLQRDILDAALPLDHPLVESGAQTIPLDGLATDQWVVPPPGWQCESVLMSACQTAGFSPEAVHRTSDWAAALALVNAGLGVSLVPRLAQAAVPPGVVLRPVEGEPPCRHIFATVRAGSERAPVITLVLDALEEAARRDEVVRALAVA
jgi:DNA-binding transcriptional LysR family regulator